MIISEMIAGATGIFGNFGCWEVAAGLSMVRESIRC